MRVRCVLPVSSLTDHIFCRPKEFSLSRMDSHRGNKPVHRGNKSFLPSKPCTVCGRPMSWRKAWERVWSEVKYCSERCRRAGRKA